MKENLLERAKILRKCEEDLAFRALVREKCRRDCVWWVDHFGYTRNPKKPEFPVLPFICYPFQIELVRELKKAINEGYDVLIEKSRDMGASWTVIFVLVHTFLFEENADFRIGSWREDFVDHIGDMDSLMEKIRFILRRLPAWMLGNINADFPFMRLINPDNENSIVGETANINFGSGGRRKALFLDEFSKWDKTAAYGCYTSTADITNCRIVCATPFGSGNKYAELASGQSDEKIKKITLHWTLHPDKSKGCYYIDIATGEKIPIKDSQRAFEIWKKNRGVVLPKRFGLKGGVVRSTWYDQECERRSQQDIAQELDIDYLMSGSPFFDMYALNEQREWEYIELPTITKIPYGKYITGDIVKIGTKVKFRQKPEELGGWLRVYELPNPAINYVLSADTCEGLPKGDTNAGIVRDAVNRNVVAVVINKIPPEDFAEQLWLVSKWYNDCLIAPENNNHGYIVCRDLQDMGCNLYYTKIYDKVKDKQTEKRGWTTKSNTRMMMLDKLAEEIRSNAIELRDDRIINQCKTFIRPENKPTHPEADGNYKDDAVLATAIGSIVLDEIPHKINTKEEIHRKMAAKAMIEKRKKWKFKRRL